MNTILDTTADSGSEGMLHEENNEKPRSDLAKSSLLTILPNEFIDQAFERAQANSSLDELLSGEVGSDGSIQNATEDTDSANPANPANVVDAVGAMKQSASEEAEFAKLDEYKDVMKLAALCSDESEIKTLITKLLNMNSLEVKGI